MTPLRIYVSASCPMCHRAHELVAEVRTLRPAYPVEIVDLDQPDVQKPDGVFGTPTYILGERIISLGNPTLQTLLDLIDGNAYAPASR